MVELHATDEKPCSKEQFQVCVKDLLNSNLPKDAGDQILSYLKSARKPCALSNGKWMRKVAEFLSARAMADEMLVLLILVR